MKDASKTQKFHFASYLHPTKGFGYFKIQKGLWDQSCTPIRYFGSVSVGIFPVFSQPIPKEYSIGTFRYCTFGGNPFFPSKGGFCPLFDVSSPPFEEKISSRQIYKNEDSAKFHKMELRQIFQYQKYRTEYCSALVYCKTE